MKILKLTISRWNTCFDFSLPKIYDNTKKKEENMNLNRVNFSFRKASLFVED